MRDIVSTDGTPRVWVEAERDSVKIFLSVALSATNSIISLSLSLQEAEALLACCDEMRAPAVEQRVLDALRIQRPPARDSWKMFLLAGRHKHVDLGRRALKAMEDCPARNGMIYMEYLEPRAWPSDIDPE